MLSLCLVWCTFVALGNPFSSATPFWWSLNWLLYRSLTVFAKENSNVTQNTEFVFFGVENNVEKGENAGYLHFLLFPRFLKSLFCRGVNSRHSLIKG